MSATTNYYVGNMLMIGVLFVSRSSEGRSLTGSTAAGIEAGQ